MHPRLIVLRPEPGNSATCERIRAAGGEAVALPLFEVRPIDWTPPDPAAFDALLLTSANAARHAGPGLAAFTHLPVVAVGEATARAARVAGLRVIATGTGGVEEANALLAAHDLVRALHLAGREHRSSSGGNDSIPPRHPGLVPGSTAQQPTTQAPPAKAHSARWTPDQVRGDVLCQTPERPAVLVVPVYASEPLCPPTLDPLTDAITLLHSPRAAARLAELGDAAKLDRTRITLAAISANALAAAGSGWRDSVVAPTIGDAPLIAAALSIDRNRCGGDKAP